MIWIDQNLSPLPLPSPNQLAIAIFVTSASVAATKAVQTRSSFLPSLEMAMAPLRPILRRRLLESVYYSKPAGEKIYLYSPSESSPSSTHTRPVLPVVHHRRRLYLSCRHRLDACCHSPRPFQYLIFTMPALESLSIFYRAIGLCGTRNQCIYIPLLEDTN